MRGGGGRGRGAESGMWNRGAEKEGVEERQVKKEEKKKERKRKKKFFKTAFPGFFRMVMEEGYHALYSDSCSMVWSGVLLLSGLVSCYG